MRQNIPTPPTPPPDPVQTDAAQAKSDLSQVIRGTVANVLQSVRQELVKERTSAIAERTALQAQLDAAKSSSVRSELRAQLQEVNARIDKLSAGIDKMDAQVDKASVRDFPAIPTIPPPYRVVNDNVPTQMIVSVITIIFVGFPLAIAVARLLWKRASHAPAPMQSQLPAESTKRFDQLEQAVDAIAIEVERISENQRYLTKLLSEPRQKVAIGEGAPPS